VVKGISTSAIEKATGLSWQDIVGVLEAAGGERLDHPGLVSAAARAFRERTDSPQWWAQFAAVGYEQQIGRRLPGQRADGYFAPTLNRTLGQSRQQTFEQLCAALEGHTQIDGLDIDGAPRTSVTEKRSFWRANLVRGDRLDFAVAAAPALKSAPDTERSTITATAEKVMGPEAADRWRQAFAELFDEVFG